MSGASEQNKTKTKTKQNKTNKRANQHKIKQQNKAKYMTKLHGEATWRSYEAEATQQKLQTLSIDLSPWRSP